ncbi:3-phosphoshikimate 1-carboxyvinyltransferase [Robertkochia marina]|uniref:3-phosphoshikimate 1-carboxyvinyltransferase n=1 Tax=Robertkochia marina TaxID=1227945 RepID=A0A4S3M1N3_9FLAO|nr:3-phosphoshikimate 1-carboxyvinyltransferase [Robertkochia marina]THD68903.1 3-phosphoshikimate 1-carboxyvinyltransferase [Robertkochia marina]TRZ41158.1 3-phosphoshikimate 1-carboxyvinyltransferase [Robertkochia marina]
MRVRLNFPGKEVHGEISVTGSKSESNRLLLLKALLQDLEIKNLSNSDDTRVMKAGIEKTSGMVDIHHAGTAMRFLTAYFATQPGCDVVLTGSARMKERPISILVDALRALGAAITYTEKDGYPPLHIKGTSIVKHEVTLDADVSSQYISALLLVAPNLENGLELTLDGKITSLPYIKMTLALLEQVGVKTDFTSNVITIAPLKKNETKVLTVESDWSSASYFYSIASVCEQASIVISSYKPDSLQGDSVLQEIYRDLGVGSAFMEDRLMLKRVAETEQVSMMKLDLANAPDIAQTIAVSCFANGVGCELTGLHTLKIKETDRLEALKTELTKLGASIEVTNDTLYLKAGGDIRPEIAIDTYNDHRMAMAFAPLALKVPIIINDAGVVSKSYPGFWDDLASLGFEVQEL